MKNICDSQSKARAFEEKKNNATENSVFDSFGVISGRKFVSEFTLEEKYYYFPDIIALKTIQMM